VDPQSRALAIRALGRCRKPAIADAVPGWLDDPEPDVRGSAALLIADYPVLYQRLPGLIGSSDAIVRQAAVRTIGRIRLSKMLPILEGALQGESPMVRAEAAQSLAAFSLAQSSPSLKRHLIHPEFGAFFTNLIAAGRPELYRRELGRVLRARLAAGSSEFSVQLREARRSWALLFDSVRPVPSDALVGLGPTLNALEQAPALRASDAQSLYLLYRKHQLQARAQAFRGAIVPAHPDWREGLDKIDRDCESRAMVCDNSRVVAMRVAAQTASDIDIDVDYYYSGVGNPQNVRMECITLTRGASNGNWGYKPGFVQPGRNTTRVNVGVNGAAPDYYDSDAIECTLYVGGSSPFGERLSTPFKKRWTRRPS
jgi:HEAT repeat protein